MVQGKYTKIEKQSFKITSYSFGLYYIKIIETPFKVSHFKMTMES